MKNVQRLILGLLAIFVVGLLVACGANSDNGTYVYKPSKTEVKEILGEQGVTDSSVKALLDQVKLEVTVTIKNDKGSVIIKGEVPGNKMDQSNEVRVDQQAKTFQSKNGEGEKIKYKVSGDVFTFDLTGKENLDQAYLKLYKNVKFKRTK